LPTKEIACVTKDGRVIYVFTPNRWRQNDKLS